MEIILLSFLLTFILYFFLPSWGIFVRFFRWKHFREKVRESLLFPVAGKASDLRPGDVFRFYGKLDALDSDGSIWVKGEKKTIAIPSKALDIYMLPANHSLIVDGWENLSHEGVRELKNYSFKTLEEGTPLFVFGRMPHGDIGEKVSLSVIIHEESMAETLIPAAVFMGDMPNLWFNWFTFLSWIFGFVFFLLFSLVPAVLSSHRFLFKVFISEALLPLLFFAPPGGLFSLLFLKLWRRGNLFRRRDELKKLFAFCEKNLSFLGQGDFECIRKICFEHNVLGEDLRQRFSFKSSLIAPALLYIFLAVFSLAIGISINFLIAIILFGKIGS